MKCLPKKSFPAHAFTLMELLIILAVLGVLLTMGIGSLSRVQGQTELKDALNVTVDFLQSARSEALSNKTFTFGSTDYMATGFYVIFPTNNAIELYAQIDGFDDQLLDQEIFAPTVRLQTQTDLEQILYRTPMAELEFVYAAGTSSTPNIIQINLSSTSSPSTRTVELSEVSRIPEVK